MNRRLTPFVALMLSVLGCSGSTTPASSPTTSSALSPAGSWSGSISDAISGDGTMKLSLSGQPPNSVAGTWSSSFRNGDTFSGVAVAALSSDGYGIVLYVQPPPACATGSGPSGSTPLGFTLINVVATSSQLTAQSGRLSCSGPTLAFGTVNLSRP